MLEVLGTMIQNLVRDLGFVHAWFRCLQKIVQVVIDPPTSVMVTVKDNRHQD
jgi:hypothetical protein